jgi:hypothetical protein
LRNCFIVLFAVSVPYCSGSSVSSINNLCNYYACIGTEGALFYVRVEKQVVKVSEAFVNDTGCLLIVMQHWKCGTIGNCWPGN